MSADEKEGGRKRKGEKIDEMEKSSSELVAPSQNLPSVRSLVSIKSRHSICKWGTDTFSFFRRENLSDLESVKSSTGMDILQRRKNIQVVFSQCSVEREVTSEFGVCWVAVFAEIEMAADAEESGLGKRQKAS